MVEGSAFLIAAASVDNLAAHFVCAVDRADVVGLVQRHVCGNRNELLGHRDLRTAPSGLSHRMGKLAGNFVHRVVESVARFGWC